jgi:hypothetical protein
MVDENQVEQYIKAIKVDALHVETMRNQQLKEKAVEDSEAYHKLALQWAFNGFCCRKVKGFVGSIGDKAKLYDTLAEVAQRLGVKMPI